MKRALLILCGALVLGAGAHPVNRTHERPSSVVLELFTSQGCSSCPPADRLLSALGREHFSGGTVIPLAYHVDYWNHLGWSDPFSSPEWSKRQNQYARAMHSSQVYTPQLVLDGTTQLVGSSERHVRTEITRRLSGGDRGVVSIDRMLVAGDQIRAHLRARLDRELADRDVDVVVVLFENGVTTSVSNGENARRNLTNDFIVRAQTRAARLHGGEATTSVALPLGTLSPHHLGVAAFLQDRQSLAIYGGSSRKVGER
jgi:hypothetical protein